jgi:hypothetical protein
MSGKSIADRYCTNKPILRGAGVNHLRPAGVSCPDLVLNKGQTREKMVDISGRMRDYI